MEEMMAMMPMDVRRLDILCTSICVSARGRRTVMD